MKTFFEARPKLIEHSALALGFFDGVHIGHQVVINQAICEAKRQGHVPAVVTFKDHPKSLVEGTSPLILTTIEQRLALFEALGVEVALVLSFSEELCRLSPKEYVENILMAAMGACFISVGYNHHFGRDRQGDADLLVQLGQVMGFKVEVTSAILLDGKEVSSSRIREAIWHGDMESAHRWLSRPYTILATVVRGSARGRSIGFPTANLSTEIFQVMPRQGVYIGQARLSKDRLIPALINVGTRPTFEQSPIDGMSIKDLARPLTIEVHLLDFDQDIYGQQLAVSFLKYLREERKFTDLPALQDQIRTDCREAISYFGSKAGSSEQTGTQESGRRLTV